MIHVTSGLWALLNRIWLWIVLLAKNFQATVWSPYGCVSKATVCVPQKSRTLTLEDRPNICFIKKSCQHLSMAGTFPCEAFCLKPFDLCFSAFQCEFARWYGELWIKHEGFAPMFKPFSLDIFVKADSPTPWKINMEPENTPLGKGKSLFKPSFSGFYVNLRGCRGLYKHFLISINITHSSPLSSGYALRR